MVMVRQPFFSAWASGSLKKIFTCRALGNQRFCMHRFRHTQGKRSVKQIFFQERFTRKIALDKNYVRVSAHRSAILGRSWLGISALGASTGITKTLPQIPPFTIPE